MARIASDALIERLADWGVDTVFGLPGDGINGIMEALRRHQDKVRWPGPGRCTRARNSSSWPRRSPRPS
jgi:TPP-dependent 2-oxoacid decarboxylase